MEWITPKTDWDPEIDRFNYTDFNRIKNNLLYLGEYAKKIAWPVALEDMGSDRTRGEYPYADEINTISDNLEKLVKGTYPIYIGEKTVYEDNGAFIGYADLNRIEGACLRLYENITRLLGARKRIAFRLSTRREPFCLL